MSDAETGNGIRIGGARIDESALPETPHDLPYDRGKLVAILDRVRQGETMDLRHELLGAVDWRGSFTTDDGDPLGVDDIARLIEYYRHKFVDVGPVYIAELISTEFMTELRARGDVVFSDQLLEIGRTQPELWKEIRAFFRRKEFATAMLVHAHEGASSPETE